MMKWMNHNELCAKKKNWMDSNMRSVLIKNKIFLKNIYANYRKVINLKYKK